MLSKFSTSVLLGLVALFVSASAGAQQRKGGGGYFELSLNGSWYRYSNGVLENELATTTNVRAGAGLAYRFLSNTAVEVNYMNSRTIDHYAVALTPAGGLTERVIVNKTSDMHNLSLSLVLYFAPKGAQFRPYIRGGGGLMVRQSKLGVTNAETGGPSSTVASAISPVEKSVSADGGIGVNLFVADAIALEGVFNVYATDLDKPEILLSYAASGGLRFIF